MTETEINQLLEFVGSVRLRLYVATEAGTTQSERMRTCPPSIIG